MKNNKKMQKIFITLLAIVLALPLMAKSYPWKGINDHEIIISQISMGNDRSRVCKVVGVAGSADNAIEMALQNAVVGVLFYGIPKQDNGVNGLNPMLSVDDYENNLEFFKTFFKKGEFMEYVSKVTSRYPTGENNVSTSEGRKVTIVVNINITKLISRLQELGFKPKGIGFR